MDKLICPQCSVDVPVYDLFDNCTVSWPNQNWLYFTCSHCKSSCHVSVKGKTISLGELDGAPGPCFFPTSTVQVEALVVDSNLSGIDILIEGENWHFPPKR